MVRFTHPLNRVKIAAPCKAEWEKMIGSHRVRFCAQCNLHVYNLSEMTRAQAEALVTATEGRLCVRYYRRRDGSIITQDCRVGLQAIKRKVSYALKAIAATTFTFLTAVGLQGLVPNSISAYPKPLTGVMVPLTRKMDPVKKVRSLVKPGGFIKITPSKKVRAAN